MKSGLIKTIVAVLVILFMLISPSFVLARAGGGESFGGGGFDSGSSWSSGSSSSDWGSSTSIIPIFTGSSSNSTCSSIIIFILIIIIIVYIVRRSKGGNTPGAGGTGGDPNTTNRSMSEIEIEEKLKQLKEIDPKFDIQKFKTHTKKVFMAVQEGWTKRDQEVCRPFMSEEVYQSHQMQLDNMIREKTINVLKKIVVGSVDFARIDLGTDYHTITMKVRAAMTDYKVKEDNPDKVIEGSDTQSPPFTEYWSYIRKSNLKTKIKDGIFDRKCPNCGAPISISVAGECKYCDANVVNGDYDWVLSEIIQKDEWAE